ncbi:unnamed protein product (macronuclear) [Paramecium tetraurelia]|uniref:Uncharacterized protein n=1 Tax=Paramecium tetraurelia TaxID=5888 RepID=A0CUV8_PARTE|nr:uncharacterized protein GSPATT00039030001 [Paramecium tetraurelia]CAK74575.1 unnamed protein product [Paramecium tetraurelia]|eukprot:XP_001441972.1 hypothetical protein (macronuclear) [Paramecium tetraurelia strain d4-2]
MGFFLQSIYLNHILNQISKRKQKLNTIYFGWSILRCQNILDIQEEPQKLNNLEQIKYLNWVVECGQNKKRIGRWVATWNGEVLQEVGGKYKNGEKQGFWKEPISNYWAKAKAFEIGEYINNVKRGFWMFIYKDQEIGGGEYNQYGEKNGEWIELSEGFCNDSQVTYKGQYKNGIKIDKWKTFMVHNGNKKMIGGGSYDNLGVKYGQWIDISKEFQADQFITYKGQYQNGRRVGQWNIFYSEYNLQDDLIDELIGGGLYDKDAKGLKIGQWTDISKGFNNNSYVTYHGQYIIGQKVGRWNTYYRRSKKKQDELMQNLYSITINSGGGLYDENGSGKKIENWIELADCFKDLSQVIYEGQYINGKKIGRWEIKYRSDDLHVFERIGGGQYDEVNLGMKVGNWIEISNEFNRTSQVMYYVTYKNGKKVGECKIMYKYDASDLPSLIGGGCYNEKGNKIGQWADIFIGFKDQLQIIQQGKYKNGKKIGSWIIIQMLNNDSKNEEIGGGSYDQEGEGIKIGKWVEICEGYSTQAQIIYDGEYKNGKKVAKWNIKHRNSADESFVEMQEFLIKTICLSGGGAYDEQGIKVGNWKEISDEFKNSSQIIWNGHYEDGRKKGNWEILYQRKSKTNYQKIGGGLYDYQNYCLMHGQWIQISEGFSNSSQLIHKGEYKNGQKVGKWETQFREYVDQPFQSIGFGCYEQRNGIKNGNWTEPSWRFWDETQIIYEGEYYNDKKIGLWMEKKREKGNVDSFRNQREIVYDHNDD